MYNVCTIMYTHIRSQASDWNCCVKRLFVCTTVHIPYSTYHVKTNPTPWFIFLLYIYDYLYFISQDRDMLSHQFRGQQGGGTSTHERDLDL